MEINEEWNVSVFNGDTEIVTIINIGVDFVELKDKMNIARIYSVDMIKFISKVNPAATILL
ncbi:MAG: hypothetical protein R8M45_03585 [Ghiorsea sp.]